MIKKIITTVAFTWYTTAAALAAGWTLVDDMNYADQAAFDAVWSPDPLDTPDDGAGGGAELAADPDDAGNSVLSMVPGVPSGLTTNAYNNFAARSLPAGSEISAMGTVFFRVKVPTVDVGGTLVRAVADVTWGLSWRSPIADPLNPNAATEITGSYGDYSIVARNEFDHSFDVYDLGNPAGTYQSVLVDGIQTDVWYDIWYVCDHANNRFKVYAKGPLLGNGVDQVLIYPFDPDTHDPIGWSNERSPSLEPLRSFLIYSSAGTGEAPKGIDPMYIDDIYVDNTGENLTSPLVADESGEAVNVSTRGFVGTGADIMIVGFAIEGGSRTVLLRGVGPTLGDFGVPGTVADPEITLFSGANAIATNDNWSDAANAADIAAAFTATGAFALPDGSLDACILINLEPGLYTLQVSGKDGGTGVALGEAYGSK